MTPEDVTIHPAPDLRDPKAMVAQLRSMAGGMEQQAIASQSGTALSGHPYPAFFFGKVGQVCAAAAAYIEAGLKTPAAPEPPPPEAKPPQQAGKGKG